ncbi:tetratricopeptide repeat protein [bacterium]|nr:tetratricopeptide repeat protein [bacterium]
MEKRKIQKITIASILVVIWLGTGFMKVVLFDRNTNFLKGDDFCLFRVEEATRYRYAKLVAEGESIPEVDYKIQYPEGLKVFKHFTTTSEIIIGKLYRILPFKKIPFHRFLIFFMFFFSSLSIFAVYLLINYLFQNKVAGIFGALFYALSFSSFARTIAGGMVEEDFALALIFLSFYFFMRSINDGKISSRILAGIFLFIPLTSWHVTQFYYTILVSFIVIQFLLRKRTYFMMRSFTILVLFNFLAGAFVPVLNTGDFNYSYPMVISYSLILVYYLEKYGIAKEKGFRIFLFAASSIILGILVSPKVQAHSEEYAHVYTLLLNKIIFLGKKPSYAKIVKELPFDTKVMWQSSFVSPSWNDVKTQFPYLIFLGIFGIFKNLWNFTKRKISIPEEGILYFLFVFFILYLLIERMYVFFAFFLAIFIGATISYLWVYIKKLDTKFLIAFSLILTLFLFFHGKKSISMGSKVSHRIIGPRQDVIKWVKNNAQENAVVLADIGISPEIVAFAGRKTIVHNHYEAVDIRRKTEEYYRALFEDEDYFYGLCRKYGADYVVHDWDHLIDMSKGGIRYQIDAMKVYKDDIIYLLNFEPENLKYFTLLYQNNNFRIYQVREKKGRVSIPKLTYIPFFNKRTFVPERKEIVSEEDKSRFFFDDDYAQVVMAKVWDMPNVMRRGNEYRKKGMNDKALAEYKKNIDADPYMPAARITLGEFLLSLERYEEAIEQFKVALRLDPSFTQAYYFLGISYYGAGKKTKAVRSLKKALKLSPDNKLIKNVLKDIM